MRILLILCAVVYGTTPLKAQTTETGQVMMWSAYDAFQEDREDVEMVRGELAALNETLVHLRTLTDMYARMFHNSAMAEREFREKSSELAQAEARVRRMEHNLVYFEKSQSISDTIRRLESGEQIDFIALQKDYWDKWEQRCLGYVDGQNELNPRIEFLNWAHDRELRLRDQMASTMPKLLGYKMMIAQAKQKHASFTRLHEACKNGPPFPKLADFGHLKR